MHELDSAAGFELFNQPAKMRNPRDVMKAASHINYTFNWFYVNNRHIAYFNSGDNPLRARGTNPLFPSWSRFAWRGFDPATLTAEQTPPSAHPQVVDQPVLTSWNNKQAAGYNDAATGQQFSSVFRSQLLDKNLSRYLRRGRGRITLADLINAMGNAGTQDLRGVEVLPYALRILGHPRNRRARPSSGRAARMGGERCAPYQPRSSKRVGELRPDRRDTHHGCLVAPTGEGRVPARARRTPARRRRGQLPNQ